jgi:hypothetical protein
MEARDLKSPEDITSLLDNIGTTEQWQQKYGASENKVGDLRQELEGLRQQVSQQPANEYGEPNSVNLGDLVEERIVKVMGNMNAANQKAQMKYVTERNDLMKRPGWNDVQPYFDKALQNPEISMSLHNGTMTQDKLYNQINERVLMSKVQSFVETMPKGALKEPPPNTETSERILQPTPELEAKKQRMNKAVENQDVDALLKDMIPDNDPIVKY